MEHLQKGTKVERRRREDRGAEGAEWLSAACVSMEAPKASSARAPQAQVRESVGAEGAQCIFPIPFAARAPQARVSRRRRRPVDERHRRQYVGAKGA